LNQPKTGSIKDRAALFLIKEGIRLNKITHLKPKDAPPPTIVGNYQQVNSP